MPQSLAGLPASEESADSDGWIAAREVATRSRAAGDAAAVLRGAVERGPMRLTPKPRRRHDAADPAMCARNRLRSSRTAGKRSPQYRNVGKIDVRRLLLAAQERRCNATEKLRVLSKVFESAKMPATTERRDACIASEATVAYGLARVG